MIVKPAAQDDRCCKCGRPRRGPEAWLSQEKYGYPPVRLERDPQKDDRHQTWRKPQGRQAWVCGSCCCEAWVHEQNRREYRSAE